MTFVFRRTSPAKWEKLIGRGQRYFKEPDGCSCERWDGSWGCGSGGEGESLVELRNCGYGEQGVVGRGRCQGHVPGAISFNNKHLEGASVGADHKFS